MMNFYTPKTFKLSGQGSAKVHVRVYQTYGQVDPNKAKLLKKSENLFHWHIIGKFSIPVF